ATRCAAQPARTPPMRPPQIPALSTRHCAPQSLSPSRQEASMSPEHATRRRATQRGMTLVELMVALLLGSLIVLAAMAALTVSRQGFLAVDASAQLRDNARFATSIIRRLATQAAYLDFKHASTLAGTAFKVGASTVAEIEPSLKGFNN